MNRIHSLTAKAIVTPQPAPAAVPLPSSEFLTDLARRLATTPDRTFTAESLRFVLTMSARLTHQCGRYNTAAGRTWRQIQNGTHSTRKDRERVMKDAHDLADYAWNEAIVDADRAHAFLVDTTVSTMSAADLLARIRSVSVRTAVAA